tara:strand:+ start:901 stop:1119 length:219 start_codon:yes stop_codon:yes gene_type:complete
MNLVNRKILWSQIQKRGDLLKDKLIPDPRHPKGRNPYAHICSLIKKNFGYSYKDVPDTYFREVYEFIKNIKN